MVRRCNEKDRVAMRTWKMEGVICVTEVESCDIKETKGKVVHGKAHD